MRSVLLEPRSQKLFSAQIMSADKYPNTFLCQMEAIAYKFNTQTLQNVRNKSHEYFDA